MDADGFGKLLDRAREGDRAALEEILRLVRPYVARVAHDVTDRGRPSQAVSDLIQEAELRAWERLKQFDGAADDDESLQKFRVWIGRIVQRLGLSVHRRRDAQRRKPPTPLVSLDRASPDGGASAPSSMLGIDPVGQNPTPSREVRADEERLLILAAIEAMPDEFERQIVRGKYFEGESLRQIAARLDASYDKVKERHRCAMKQLERKLRDLR